MKKTYQYIALAALALSLAACSQEDDFIPQGNQKGAPITIASVGVANLATRATIEDDKLVEGNIGVTITSTGNDERYTGSNVNWYGSNGVWGLGENQKVVLYEGNGESQKVYAYYPYAKDIIEGTENLPVTLPEAFGSNFEGYDYLCTKEGISLSQNPVSLTLSHAFSKVSVSVNVMGNELEGDVVTEIALANVPLNGERSATTGAIDPDKYGPANGRIALYGYDDEDYDEVADYYIGYALPNAATTLDLRVTMQSGRIFTAKAPISGGMTDGVHYKIGLNVGKDKLEVRTVTVVPWGTGGAIEGGVAEEVIPNTFDATAMTPEQLNAAVAKALDYGHTELGITLAADADATMFSAITAALATTVDPSLDQYELVMNYSGTIDLTISGAKTVPENTFYVVENENENWRAGAALRSVTLTDATTIGESAFAGSAMTSFSAPNVIAIEDYAFTSCMNLTDVYLPSVQTLGGNVFFECYALKTISLPECIDLGNGVFNSCEALETVYAPKATNLGAIEFMMCTSLMKVTLGSVVSVNQLYESIDNGLFCLANDTQNIELVLSSDQKVMTFDSGTKYWTATETDYNGSDYHNNKSFIGYTFKSVTLQ